MTRTITESSSTNYEGVPGGRHYNHGELLQHGDARNGLDVGFVPALDVTKVFTSMFEFGAGMLRVQQQMFAGVLGAIPRLSDPNDRGANGLPGERQLQAERELIAVRAWEIARSPRARGDLDNWLLAERELRAAGRITQV